MVEQFLNIASIVALSAIVVAAIAGVALAVRAYLRGSPGFNAEVGKERIEFAETRLYRAIDGTALLVSAVAALAGPILYIVIAEHIGFRPKGALHVRLMLLTAAVAVVATVSVFSLFARIASFCYPSDEPALMAAQRKENAKERASP